MNVIHWCWSLAGREKRCNGNPIAVRNVLTRSSTVELSDCLIEGSAKDAVSHFTLRVICQADPEMSSFFQRAESMLFYHRVSCMTTEELKSTVKPLKKYHEMVGNSEESGVHKSHAEVVDLLEHVTQIMNWETLIDCYSECTEHTVMLPWFYVPSLVARRMVKLRKGDAVVKCEHLPEILRAIFDRLLSFGMRRAEKKFSGIVESDDRIERLSKNVKDMFYAQFRRSASNGDCVGHEQVDRLSDFFPPCMKNLHNQLRTRHRLGHHNRIMYTLFLKEVGLPVSEALQFWKLEYSQPAKNGSPCKHCWEKDAKRYTCNIRHLYGLEGRRTNYKGHSCASIQASDPNPLESGGCPFKHFDAENLETLLRSQFLSLESREAILSTAGENRWSHACCLLFEHRKRRLIHRNSDSSGVNGGIPNKENARIGEVESTVTAVHQGTETMVCAEQRKKRPREDDSAASEENSRCITFSDSPYKDLEQASVLLRKDTNIVKGLWKDQLSATCDVVPGKKRKTNGDVEGLEAGMKTPRTTKSSQVDSAANVEEVGSVKGVGPGILEECAEQNRTTRESPFCRPDKTGFFYKPVDFYRSYKTLVRGLGGLS